MSNMDHPEQQHDKHDVMAPIETVPPVMDDEEESIVIKIRVPFDDDDDENDNDHDDCCGCCYLTSRGYPPASSSSSHDDKGTATTPTEEKKMSRRQKRYWYGIILITLVVVVGLIGLGLSIGYAVMKNRDNHHHHENETALVRNDPINGTTWIDTNHTTSMIDYNKTVWPELLYMDADIARSFIESERPDITDIEILSDHNIYVTADYRLDRVRIFTNDDAIVTHIPQVG